MQTPLSVLLKNKGYALHAVSPEINAYECAAKMDLLGIGALVVIEKEQLVGIISERDFLRKVLSKRLDPLKIQVHEIMTKNPLTVNSNTTVQEAMQLITQHRFRHLPVVDEGKLVGMISIGDLTRWVMLAQENEISALTGYIHGTTR